MEIDLKEWALGLGAWVGIILAFLAYRSEDPGWFWWLGISLVCGLIFLADLATYWLAVWKQYRR